MSLANPAADLERRKRLRIRLRPDLAIEEQRYEGKTFYVVKDPVSLRYYRLKDNEHFLLQFLDGKHTLDEAQKAYEREFRPERLRLEDLEGFAQQLLTAGLAMSESPRAGKQLYERRGKRIRREWMQTFSNILYIKIPIFDPERILKWMLGYLGWIFSLWFFILSVVFMGAAILLVATHFETFRSKLPSYPILQSEDGGLPLVRPGGGQGHPRVWPRTELQAFRRRGSRNGRLAHVLLARAVLQRLRCLGFAQQVAPHRHQFRRYLRRADHRRHRDVRLVEHADAAVYPQPVAVADDRL
jgi:hypothetical protein